MSFIHSTDSAFSVCVAHIQALETFPSIWQILAVLFVPDENRTVSRGSQVGVKLPLVVISGTCDHRAVIFFSGEEEILPYLHSKSALLDPHFPISLQNDMVCLGEGWACVLCRFSW